MVPTTFCNKAIVFVKLHASETKHEVNVKSESWSTALMRLECLAREQYQEILTGPLASAYNLIL